MIKFSSSAAKKEGNTAVKAPTEMLSQRYYFQWMNDIVTISLLNLYTKQLIVTNSTIMAANYTSVFTSLPDMFVCQYILLYNITEIYVYPDETYYTLLPYLGIIMLNCFSRMFKIVQIYCYSFRMEKWLLYISRCRKMCEVASFKNFENRLTTVKVMTKSKVAPFYLGHGVLV